MYKVDIHSISVWYGNPYRPDGTSLRMGFDGQQFNGKQMSLVDVVAFIDENFKTPTAFIAYSRDGMPVWNFSMDEARRVLRVLQGL
jgi:hypothetical protein